MRVLIVEDEARLANFISKGMKETGYVSDIAKDAKHADYFVSTNDYDLILLDWLLPDISGLELCKKWRLQGRQTPLIMITAKDNREDIISGLDCGADDYLVKPFSFSELLARIRALLRRASVMPASLKLELDDLVVDLARHEVTKGKTKIVLSGREFSLLEYLMRNAGKVVTKTQIAEHVWGEIFYNNTNVIDVYINHLRKKLNCRLERPLIHTIRGTGYIMEILD